MGRDRLKNPDRKTEINTEKEEKIDSLIVLISKNKIRKHPGM